MRFDPPLQVRSPTPTLAVLGFRKRLVFLLHLCALIAVAPLLIVQWQKAHFLLFSMLVLLCLNALLVIGFLHFRQTYFLQGRLLPILAVIAAVYSTSINEHHGLYWAYPTATVLFFLLPLREAIAGAIILVTAMAAVSFVTFPLPELWRITFSLGTTSLFAMVFAWMVSRLQLELVRLATTDPLTGCLNRSQLADILNNHIQLRERYERVSSLIVFDLDFFKAINDRWGHLAGDKVLKEIVLRIRGRLRESDQLFRIGGEEFMIVLPETRQKDAEALAHQLLSSIRMRPVLDDIHVTASASVAEVALGESWSEWLNRADQALYGAKSGGRNRVERAPRGYPTPPTEVGSELIPPSFP